MISQMATVKSFVADMSVGEVAGYSFALAYSSLLFVLFQAGSRRRKQIALAKQAAAGLDGKPPWTADRGFNPQSNVLPTRLDDLTTSDYATEPKAEALAGWVSPLGYYYQLPSPCGHSRLADRITGTTSGSRALENLGWIHLNLAGGPDLHHPHKMTTAQRDTLTDIAMLCADTRFASAIMSGIEVHSQ